MLKKTFENEILKSMEVSLHKQANNRNTDNLEQAVDYLNSAIDIFEDAGLTAQADQILNVLSKIAKKGRPKRPKDPRTVSDRHTKGLTSEQAIKNLKNHGTMFNMADVSSADDILNTEIILDEEFSDGFDDDFEDV